MANSTTEEELVIDLLSRIDKSIVKWHGSTEPERLHEIRKRIFTVHAMVDKQLTLFIADYFFHTIQPEHLDPDKFTEADFTKWANMLGTLAADVFEGMRFKEKLIFAKKLGAIDEEVFKILNTFNELRNSIGHSNIPSTGDKKVFEDNAEYLNALKKIYDATQFCKEFGLKWFDEIDELVMSKRKDNKKEKDKDIPF